MPQPLALVEITTPFGLEHWDANHANFGRIQPCAFTRPSAVHKSALLNSTGESHSNGRSIGFALIRVIRVQKLWAILGADCSWPETDRTAVPKLRSEPKCAWLRLAPSTFYRVTNATATSPTTC